MIQSARFVDPDHARVEIVTENQTRSFPADDRIPDWRELHALAMAGKIDIAPYEPPEQEA